MLDVISVFKLPGVGLALKEINQQRTNSVFFSLGKLTQGP